MRNLPFEDDRFELRLTQQWERDVVTERQLPPRRGAAR
jgi:hypothetical protein